MAIGTHHRPLFELDEDGSGYAEFLSSYDWSSTAIGDPNLWPQTLWTVVDLILRSKFPMIIIWGPEHGVVYNEAYAKLFPRKHPRWLGKPWPKMWADRWELVGPIFQQALEGKATFSSGQKVPLNAPREGDIYLSYSFSRIQDEHGEFAGLYCILSDVTEEHLVMEELDKRVALQSAILSQMQEGVIVTDVTGRVTFANDAARQITGIDHHGMTIDRYGEDEVVRTVDGRVLAIEEYPLSRAVLGETVLDERILLRRRDGKDIIAVLSARPIRGSTGIQIGAVLTLRDDTFRTQAEEAMRDLNEALETRVAARTQELEETQAALRQSQKMDAVGRLTGGIAHDLNNNMLVVGGSLDLLDRRTVDERSTKLIENAKGGVRRATSLTQQLLAFARQQPLTPARVAANELVANMCLLISKSLAGDIEMKSDLEPDLIDIWVDGNQLENAVLNLAVNANDAMPDGGRLTIRTRNLEVAEEDGHRVLEPGSYIEISVIDTGVGMPKDVLEKAFDPFFTTKELGKGTGLGLSQVYGFLRQSGGHVEIDSREGVGTTVSMYLPKGNPDLGADEEPEAPREKERASGSILVVDDESNVRELLVGIFVELGYQVIEADGGAAAIKVMQSDERIDLLCTDVRMPGMSGWRLAEEAEKVRPGLKVVFMTGFSQDGGADERGVGKIVIDKPFSIEDLEEKIQEVLGKAG